MEPKNEKCKCQRKFPLILVWTSGNSLFSCFNCNLERDEPDLPKLLRAGIRSWGKNYEKVYQKWLKDDCHYDELADIESALNSEGLKLVHQINEFDLCYYWLHTYEKPEHFLCPRCSQKLIPYKVRIYGIRKICKSCKILIHDE